MFFSFEPIPFNLNLAIGPDNLMFNLEVRMQHVYNVGIVRVGNNILIMPFLVGYLH